MEYSSATRNKGSFPIAATWMDLEGIMLSKIRDRYCMMALVEYKKAKCIDRQTDENGGSPEARRCGQKRIVQRVQTSAIR